MLVLWVKTGISWLCYFRALQMALASRVAPIDKLSVASVIVFAVICLGEPLTWKLAIGGVSPVVAGAVVLATSTRASFEPRSFDEPIWQFFSGSNGAAECSHGWSKAKPVVGKGDDSAPGGAASANSFGIEFTSESVYLPLLLPGHERIRPALPRPRSRRLCRRAASPVATFQRPVGRFVRGLTKR